MVTHHTLSCRCWTKPLPLNSPFSTTNIRTTNIQLLNGSLEQRIIWDYSLSGETLDKIFWEIQREEDNIGTRIVVKGPSRLVGITDAGNVLEHFNISSSDPATLIIHHDVT